jgi:hypothetical protein
MSSHPAATRLPALEAVAEAARLVDAYDYCLIGKADEIDDAFAALSDALRALDATPAPTPALAADDPQWDATDAAHPAWWRGNDHAFEQMRRQLATRLGAPPDTCWQALLDAAESEAKAKARKAAAAKVNAAEAVHRCVSPKCPGHAEGHRRRGVTMLTEDDTADAIEKAGAP